MIDTQPISTTSEQRDAAARIERRRRVAAAALAAFDGDRLALVAAVARRARAARETPSDEPATRIVRADRPAPAGRPLLAD